VPSHEDVIDLMLRGKVRFDGVMILDPYEVFQLMDSVKAPENAINKSTKETKRNELLVYDSHMFTINYIRVDPRPEDSILYDDCACKIWHENMWHIRAKLGDRYDGRFLVEAEDDPQFTLRVSREGIIELLPVHMSQSDGEGLPCPNCNSTVTSKHEYGGLEYYQGWMCNNCGFHGESDSEWEAVELVNASDTTVIK
jgi:hypothetical protein